MSIVEEPIAVSITRGETAVMTTPPTGRKRGRPLEMQPDEVLLRIRQLNEQQTLFRVHLHQPALYARARRLFGTWARAVALAGLDHASAVSEARRRAVEARRRRWSPGRARD